MITCPEDIVIQIIKDKNKYISLDGHTRLYIAIQRGYTYVYGIESKTDEYIHEFVKEAKHRKIFVPSDLKILTHDEYREKWDQFCDAFFAKETRK